MPAGIKHSWTRLAILAIGWGLALAYAFPGFMSTDSVSQLQQSRGLEAIGDGNPPFMALVWKISEWFVAGAFGMLLLQTATFLLGVDAVLRRFFGPRMAAAVAVGVLLFPPVSRRWP